MSDTHKGDSRAAESVVVSSFSLLASVDSTLVSKKRGDSLEGLYDGNPTN